MMKHIVVAREGGCSYLEPVIRNCSVLWWIDLKSPTSTVDINGHDPGGDLAS